MVVKISGSRGSQAVNSKDRNRRETNAVSSRHTSYTGPSSLFFFSRFIDLLCCQGNGFDLAEPAVLGIRVRTSIASARTLHPHPLHTHMRWYTQKKRGYGVNSLCSLTCEQWERKRAAMTLNIAEPDLRLLARRGTSLHAPDGPDANHVLPGSGSSPPHPPSPPSPPSLQ